jgi:hypothetical protein
MPLYRRLEKNAQLLGFNCVEFVKEFTYGHLRKLPGKGKEVHISHGFLTSASVPMVIAVALLAPLPVAGQPASPPAQGATKAPTSPRTSDGKPDLQGVWPTAPSPRWSGRSPSERRRSSPTSKRRNGSSSKTAAKIATSSTQRSAA